MKKFALLGAVAALATAGGVFAAWNFATGSVQAPADQTITVTVDSAAVSSQAYGTFSVSGSIELTLTGNGNVDANTPVLVADEDNNEITITYTSNFAGSETVPLEAEFKGVSNREGIGDTDVDMTVSDLDISENFTDSNTQLVITAAEVISKFSFTGTIDTAAELAKFVAGMSDFAIKIGLTVGTVTVA